MAAPAGRGGLPTIMVVERDDGARSRILEELTRRYGDDYRIVGHRTPQSALAGLTALAAGPSGSGELALVLADRWGIDDDGSGRVGGMGSTGLAAAVHQSFPDARRALLIDWGGWADPPTRAAILHLMALGQIDYYVIKPWRPRDEYFHRTVTEFLLEWERATTSTPREVTVVAQRWSARGHELRSLLARNGVPHAFHETASPDGQAILHTAGLDGASVPVVRLHDGRVLVDPDNATLARAYGVSTELDETADVDLVVVGAGPAGLAAAVYASSEGLSCLVIERESIGGQAGSSSLIRNYLGFARGISGAELAQRAYQQAWVFGASFLLMREAVALTAGPDGLVVTTAEGWAARARAVILATGVSYRRLGVPAVEALAGAGVYYGASVSEARAMVGEDVFVVGGGNSAGQAALHLARYARRVTLLVRGESLAESMSRYLIDELSAAGVVVRLGTEVADGGGRGRLEHLTLRELATGATETVAAGAVFVLIGAAPRTEWLRGAVRRDRWGYLVTGAEVIDANVHGVDMVGTDPAPGWPLRRAPLPLETSVPGVFAVGDVRARSVKRVASAVGEGSVAVGQVHEYLASAVGMVPPQPARR
jgi:thioredoxin reductase (NADPH)